MDFQGQPEEYDLLILGSGAGAKVPAWTFGARPARRSGRTQICRRIVSEYRVPAHPTIPERLIPLFSSAPS
jgi:hypothetical protein